MTDALRGAADSRTPQSRQVNFNMQQELERSNSLYDQYLRDLSGYGWSPTQMGRSDFRDYRNPTSGGDMAFGFATGGLYDRRGRDGPVTEDELGKGTNGTNPGGKYGAWGGDMPPRQPSLVEQARERANRTYATTESGLQGMLDRGFGMDPRSEAAFADLAGVQGGLSDENVDRIRGKGVFDEFARTGGWTPQMKQDAAAKGNAPNVGIYEGLRSELGRRRTGQGGAPGTTAADLMSVRDQSRQASENSRDTEMGIAEAVNRGRQWGTSGLSDAEKALVAQISGNRIAGAGGLQKGLETGRAQNMGVLDMLRQLREGTPGEVALYEKLIQEVLAQRAQAAGIFTGQQAGYNPNESFQDRMSKNIDIAGSVMSMGAGF